MSGQKYIFICTLDPKKTSQLGEGLNSYIRRLRKDAQINRHLSLTAAKIHLQGLGKLERGNIKTMRLNQKTKTNRCYCVDIAAVGLGRQ